MGDTGVVQTSLRGSAEPIDSRGEGLERAVDQGEERRVVRVRLQKAQGLVETKQRPRVAHDGAADAQLVADSTLSGTAVVVALGKSFQGVSTAAAPTTTTVPAAVAEAAAEAACQ